MTKFQINGIDYYWETEVVGAWFFSREKKVPNGTVRYFKDRLFYSQKYSRVFQYESDVLWLPVEKDKILDGKTEKTVRNNWFKEYFL